MVMKNKRIVYMGTPDFAVMPLSRLVDGGYNVVGVVTVPDKEAGRGRNVTESAVKRYAKDKGLPVLQPERLKRRDISCLFARNESRHYSSGGIQNVARGGVVDAIVRHVQSACLSVASLWGAAPINRAIMNGDTVTGVTTFMLDKQIDTGRIIMQRSVEIEPDDCAGTLHDKLMVAGSRSCYRDRGHDRGGWCSYPSAGGGRRSFAQRGPQNFQRHMSYRLERYSKAHKRPHTWVIAISGRMVAARFHRRGGQHFQRYSGPRRWYVRTTIRAEPF